MADEAVILQLSGVNPTSYLCDATTSISKGTLLKLSGTYAVAKSSASGEVYAGVAAMDKDGTDSSTQISVHVPGSDNFFDMKVGSSTVTSGAVVSLSGANLIGNAIAADLLTGEVIGVAQEEGTTGVVIRVKS